MRALGCTSILERSFDDLLAQAASFHGHLCPGLVLGVRMTVAGCRSVGVEDPRLAGKSFVVLVEIDRCATDAIQALTGTSPGKRTLKLLDYGKMAATFVNLPKGIARRVVARDDARALVPVLAPEESDPRPAQARAYRLMAEPDLLRIEPVVVAPAWIDRRRTRVYCVECGEGINYQREVTVRGRTLCRACAGERYYAVVGRDASGGFGGSGPAE